MKMKSLILPAIVVLHLNNFVAGMRIPIESQSGNGVDQRTRTDRSRDNRLSPTGSTVTQNPLIAEMQKINGDTEALGDCVNSMFGKVQIEILEELQQLRQKINLLAEINATYQTPQVRNDSQSNDSCACGTDSLQCPSGYVGFNNWVSCYRFSNFNDTWNSANEHCLAQGGHLVFIETTRENFLLKYLIKNTPELRHVEAWWLGGKRDNEWQGWVWRDRMETKEMSFTNWPRHKTPEPDFVRCLATTHNSDYLWYDDPCLHRKHNFICEVNAFSWNL